MNTYFYVLCYRPVFLLVTGLLFSFNLAAQVEQNNGDDPLDYWNDGRAKVRQQALTIYLNIPVLIGKHSEKTNNITPSITKN